MTNDKNLIEPLDKEIAVVSLENFMKKSDYFDKLMKQDFKQDLKRAFKIMVLVFITTLITICGAKFFPGILANILSGGSLIASFGYFLVSEINNETKKRNKTLNSELQTERNQEEIKDVSDMDISNALDDIENMKVPQGSDYYTDFAKKVLDNQIIESDEERKYREALARQNSKIVSLVNNGFVDKKATIDQLLTEYNVYSAIYTLPPMNVSMAEISMFFGKIYEFLEKYGIKKEFYQSTTKLCRYVYARSLVDKHEFISLFDFINAIPYLDVLSEKELLTFQREMLLSFQKNNVVELKGNDKAKRKIR